jgi:photosystem II stability/assembly factor-like uncharacterized protein
MRNRSRFLIAAAVASAAAVVTAQTPARTPARPAQSTAARPAPPAPKPAAALIASVDPALFKGLKYRLVGPSRGGRVTTVTGVPSQPKTFYMGVASGGLFKTVDGGVSWAPVTDGQVPLGSTGAVAVADSNPDVVYLGTGSDDVRSNVSTGRGIYKSNDAGKTWKFSGLRDSGQIGGIRIHPSDPNTLWVAAQGDAFKDNSERGVFKSTDGGATWKKVLFVSDSVGAMDVELQPGNPNVVYAWMSHLQRKPWTIISGGREGGFYKSTDGGEHFTKIAAGLPNELIGKANIGVSAASPNRVYALIEAKPGGGLYRSEDAGQTWTKIDVQPASAASGMIQRPFYYDTLGVDPTNADVVYAGAEGFFKSVDAGKTFTSMRTPHGDNHDIWISPKDGNTMIQSNDGGANVSTDGGRTWTTLMNQPTGEFYGVWTDDQFPYKLYGAQQDDNTVIISSVADPYNLADWRAGPGCETGPIMPQPKNPDIVYGSCKGQYGVMDLKTGQERNYWVGAQSLYGNPAKDLIYRFQRVSPMATSPHDPDVLYYGSQYLHRTRDKGVTWEKISPDLTAHPDYAQGVSGEPITRDVTGEEFYSTLYAITESTLEKGVIWTGSNDGPFFVTRDNAKTWSNVTPKDLQPGGRVQYIEASPHRRGSAYYAVYRYLLGDYAPYIYKTDDYGKTWTRLTDGRNGIPADTPTRVVREDPDREGLLYAGTEFGMYISFDNGGHWQPFNLNLPQVPITDIKVFHKDLIVSTQGRGFWILDNVSALHQLNMDMPVNGARIYRPRDGYRTRVSPLLLGPQIDYYLGGGISANAITFDILDAAGAVVNHYSSDTPVSGGGRGRGGRGGGGRGAGASPGGEAGAAGGAEEQQFDPEASGGGGGRGRGNAPPPRITTEPWNNRFVWDVRNAAGLTMPPGDYKLRWNNTGMEVPFKVLIDPRIAAEGVTAADLKEQFDHNVRVRELGAVAQQLLARVRAAMNGAEGDKAAKLRAIYEQLADTPEGVRYNKPGLAAHIRYLGTMTANTDQKIGRDAIERYQELKKQIDALKAEADKLLAQ